MNEWASGAGSGEASTSTATTATLDTVSPWVVGVTAVLALIAMLSWLRRRLAVSLLIGAWALVATANLASIGGMVLGVGNDEWLMADYGVGLIIDVVALLYVCSANHPAVYLFAVLTVGLFLADLAAPGHVALHAAWHVVAYLLLALIPGQLPMSADDPDYYYERRRRWQRAQQVPVAPQPWRASGEEGEFSPDYPGLYIPRRHNYFQ